MTLTLDEVIQRICQEYDPDVVVEFLNLSTEELLEAFPEKLSKYRHLFDTIEDEDNDNSDISEGE